MSAAPACEQASAPACEQASTPAREQAPTPVLTFARGVPGFPDAHRFTLVPVGAGPEDGIWRMVCLDAELEFVVAAPPTFFPDYAPDVPQEVVEQLDLDEADTVALVVVTLADPLRASTANLFAPIVVNTRSYDAAQVLLTGSAYSLRSPILAS